MERNAQEVHKKSSYGKDQELNKDTMKFHTMSHIAVLLATANASCLDRSGFKTVAWSSSSFLSRSVPTWASLITWQMLDKIGTIQHQQAWQSAQV